MKKILFAVAFVASTVAAIAGTPEGEKKATIDTKESKLEWVGEKVTGKHWGTVDIKSGDLLIDGDAIKGGTIVIDMTTINSTDIEGEWKDKLDAHLKDEDFFGTEKNPTSTFVIKSAKAKKGKNGNTHVITGDMTIKGITQSISFPARITMEDGVLKAFASFELDRTKWNIRYGSGSFFDDLGDRTVYDEFQVKFNIVAKM